MFNVELKTILFTFVLQYILSYVADPPRGFASCLEKVMKRQWGSRRDTKYIYQECGCIL